MGGQADIAREVLGIGAAICHARDTVKAGGLVDIAPLGPRVNRLCDRLAGLPVEEGAPLRPRVQALIDDFSALAQEIDARLKGLRERLAQGGGQGREPTASARAARPDAPKR